MAGIKSTPLAGGCYQGWYKDALGRRRWFKGARGKQGARETLRMARKLEDDHRQVACGYRPAAQPWESARGRGIQDAIDEYLAWGKAQGGIGGRTWGKQHAAMRARYLKFWTKKLNLATLGDLDGGTLARAEIILRDYRRKDGGALAGKTRENYADGLRAFCAWLVERRQLPENPLAGMAAFDCTPATQRRAFELREVLQLFEWIETAGHKRARRRLLSYQMAVCTGLRANELTQLRAKHFDAARGALILDPAWTKNRKEALQPLPAVLVAELAAVCKTIGAGEPLLFVANDRAKALENDLENAGLKRAGPGGEADFHSFRATFATLLDQAGASDKEQQVLLRHAAKSITQDLYTKAFPARLFALVETVGAQVLGGCSAGVVRKAVGAESMSASGGELGGYAGAKKYPQRDLNPSFGVSGFGLVGGFSGSVLPLSGRASGSSDGFGSAVSASLPPSLYSPSTAFPLQICSTGVAAGIDSVPLELRDLVGRWASLPEHVRKTIITISELAAGDVVDRGGKGNS